MTRIAIPSATHQRALNAAQNAGRLAVALNGTATFEGLVLAEGARNRAMDELRALGPAIRQAKQAAKLAERAERADRKIVERDRRAITALEIPA